MDKKEKVLKGLAACHAEPETGEQCQALGCPYWDSDYYCIRELLTDALEAFSGFPKEARVLPREELLTGWGHGWQESHLIGDDENPEGFDLAECVWINGHIMDQDGSDANAASDYWAEKYGKRYGIRIWAWDDPPAKEQREAAPWTE